MVVRQSARDTPLRVRTTLTGRAAVHCAGLDGSSPGSDVTTTGPGSLHGCREYPAQTHSSSTSFSGLLACCLLVRRRGRRWAVHNCVHACAICYRRHRKQLSRPKSTVKTFTGFQQTARKPGIPSEHWEHTSELKLRVLHLSADAGKETLMCSVRFA